MIVDHFGFGILQPNSQIDRAALGNIIFQNEQERTVLNKITHPRIRLVLLQQVLQNFLTGKSMVVLDTPLLFETGIILYLTYQKVFVDGFILPS